MIFIPIYSGKICLINDLVTEFTYSEDKYYHADCSFLLNRMNRFFENNMTYYFDCNRYNGFCLSKRIYMKQSLLESIEMELKI